MNEHNVDEETSSGELHGLMAEFADEHRLLEAVRQARQAGYYRMDAFSPFPVEGLADALDFHRTWVPQITLLAGILGGAGGYLLQFWVAAVAYPINVGGRPLNSWPYYIPITYELTILFASWLALLGMLALNGLPKPYHPVFNVPAFARASQDRFFMEIETSDPQFAYEKTRDFLQSLRPRGVYDVPE